jgi:flagellar motor switch protein FliG
MNALDRTTSSGAQKAAILLSILGEDEAAPILRNLPKDDLERITEEVANLAPVPIEVTMQVLEEYQELIAAQEFIAVGGQDLAVRLLVKAFGENGAKSMVERLTHKDDGRSFKVEALKKAEPQQLARFLAGEHAQTKALVVGHLDPKQASSLLMKLEPEARVDCVKRLATMKQFSPEAAAKASGVLNRRFGSVGDQSKRADSGFKNLADLMNRLEPTAARQILETIEAEEPKLAIDIRDMMFTFENFLEVPEPDLRELMNSVDKKTLMVALKGASEDLRAHIFRTMSSRAVEILKEDSEMMGPVRSKDVAKAQSEIVAIARKLESEGKIVLKSEGEDEYVL